MLMDQIQTPTKEQALRGREFFAEGLANMQAGRYFEAHDAWEDFWHLLRGPDRRFLQAMIHLTVGAYHHQCNNPKGARSQWGKAQTKWNEYPPGHWGVDRTDWDRWISGYLDQTATDPFPKAPAYNPDRFPTELLLAAE
jgi:hypothetical protein